MSSQNSTPKIILVTGGGRGLGRNTAISAARSGFDVIITYHSNRDAAAEVVSEIEGPQAAGRWSRFCERRQAQYKKSPQRDKLLFCMIFCPQNQTR